MAVRAKVERLVGARILELEFVAGRGYTQAGRHRAVLDDGRTVFVKSAVDELTAAWLKLEAIVYGNVDGPFLPEFLGCDEEDGLPVLVLEDLTDAHWPPPWSDGDVDAVRAALAALAATGAPNGLTPIVDWKRDWLSRWRSVAADPEPFLSTGVASESWLDANLPALEDAAGRAPLEDGSSLLHLDVRSDNIALTDRGALLVDWNWASEGNPLVDLVAWTPSLCLEAEMQPEDFVDADGVGEIAALICGVWAQVAGLPPPPTAHESVRELQLAQLRVVLPWACRSLGIPEPG